MLQSDDELKREIGKGKKWTSKKKQIVLSNDFKIVRGHYDIIKDLKMDDYFVLIKIYTETKEIGLGVVAMSDFEIKYEIKGKNAQEVYNVLFNEMNFKCRLDHAAYIGKELKKAEIALESGKEYLQE